jgi:hypothetical protein
MDATGLRFGFNKLDKMRGRKIVDVCDRCSALAAMIFLLSKTKVRFHFSFLPQFVSRESHLLVSRVRFALDALLPFRELSGVAARPAEPRRAAV